MSRGSGRSRVSSPLSQILHLSLLCPYLHLSHIQSSIISSVLSSPPFLFCLKGPAFDFTISCSAFVAVKECFIHISQRFMCGQNRFIPFKLTDSPPKNENCHFLTLLSLQPSVTFFCVNFLCLYGQKNLTEVKGNQN